MNLRDFLRQREKELTSRIAELHARMAQLEADATLYREAKALVDQPVKKLTFGDSFGEPFAEHRQPSEASTALRHFLVHHEEDLDAQINTVRAELRPMEAELSEIRRCKAAVGLTALVENLAAALNGLGRFAHAASEAQKGFASTMTRAQQAGGEAAIRNAALIDALEQPPQPSPYAHLTMKQLVVKALTEHFQGGATTRQLIDFFRDAWGRKIERTNLSPQITRLYQEGVIGREEGAKAWYLVPEERRGRHPYRLLTSVLDMDDAGNLKRVINNAGDVVLLHPDQVIEGVHMPLGEPVADPDPDED